MAESGLDFEIDASEINELIKQFPEYADIVLDETEIAMISSLFMFQELIQAKTPVNFGTLRQSFIPSKPLQRGQSITGNVSTSLAYGIVMERGRTPGSKMPPVNAIELWVRRKLGITGDESRGAAFVIARSIAKKGIKGVFMVENAFEEGSPQAIKLFDLAIEKAVDKIEKRIEAID
jgi:hypothetical protein